MWLNKDLNIETIEDKDIILKIQGRIYTKTAPPLAKSIDNLLGKSKNIIVDFKDVTYMSSAGLRILLRAQKGMKNGCTLKVINVNEDVMSIFDMTGFKEILDVE